MPIRRPKSGEFNQTRNQRIMHSSYRNLGYPLGCSRSELDAALKEGDFILESKDGKCGGFARVKSLAAGNCYFDFHVQDCAVIEAPLRELLNSATKQFAADRFYVQLFPYEQEEISSLEKIGFFHEATMSSQVFIRGEYTDLLIYRSFD